MESTGNNFEFVKRDGIGHHLFQKADTYTSDLVKHLVFISSILVGFLFTVISDLVLSPQDTNDLIVTLIFSSLMVSSFSLLASIIFGATYQYLFNLVIREQLHHSKNNDSKTKSETKDFYTVNEFFDEEVRPLARFVFFGSAPILIAFLIGIFFFIISFILIGWLHSPSFALIGFILSVVLGVISLFSGYKTISLYRTYKESRSDK